MNSHVCQRTRSWVKCNFYTRFLVLHEPVLLLLFVWCFRKVAEEHKLLPGLDDLSVYSIVGTGWHWCGMRFVTLVCLT
jgi:hypothetical protein